LEQFTVRGNGELLHLFVLTQLRTENRFTLFLELLWPDPLSFSVTIASRIAIAVSGRTGVIGKRTSGFSPSARFRAYFTGTGLLSSSSAAISGRRR